MTQPKHVDAAIARAYQLESVLRILSMAGDGEEISNMTFEKAGGGAVIDMAADMAAEIIEGLESGELPASKTR